MMLIDEHGNVEGSVTGGCVEAALVGEALAVLDGAAPKLLSYGTSDELAGDVGLMCGGTVHILVNEVAGDDRQVLEVALGAADDGEPVAIAMLLDGAGAGAVMALVGDELLGGLGHTHLLDMSVAGDARGLLAQGATLVRRYAQDGARMGADLRVHFRSYSAAPQMTIFGAVDFSAALAVFARQAGYVVTICDPRPPFARSLRFSDAAEVVIAWPDSYFEDREFGDRDAIIVMTHDPKLDQPALLGALESEAGYVGALGSRRTQQDRNQRLRALGIGEHELERIAAPCGLDIGARTPAEISISILAEIIAERSGRCGGRLTGGSGPVRAGSRIPVDSIQLTG
jgi:xanthine dehydrogenase accessory factor